MSINTPAPAGQHRTDPRPPDTGPGAARDYARRLREDGGTYRGIAAAAGLAPTTVHDLVSGRRPGTPYTATALRAVTSQTLPRARLDAGGTRLRLRALHVMGHGSARIARAAGVREMTIRALVRGDARTISPQLRDTIADLYDAWWDKRAPERTRAERGAATTARKRAIAGNWCAAAALDDDQLDIPGYRPRHGWKPATGTGTAPDIRPTGAATRKEGTMAADDRMNLDFILEFLDVLERHGYHYHDDQHTGRAVGLLGDLARIYEGTQETPAATYHAETPPSPQPETATARTASRPGRRHPLGHRDRDHRRRAGRSRRLQARPGRHLRRLRGPVLRHLPVAPPGRRDLRPPGHPDALGRRGLPGRHRQAAHPRQRVPSPQPAPDGSRQGGRPVTTPRKTPAGPRTPRQAHAPDPAPAGE